MSLEQAKKEEIRWRVLQLLDRQRPDRVGRAVLRRGLKDWFGLVTTADELKTELDYLQGKELITLGQLNSYTLTADGIDVVEGNAPAPPGITGIEHPSDLELTRRREVRWRILRIADAGRPVPVARQLVLSILNDMALALVQSELTREILYLSDRGLLKNGGDPLDLLVALTPDGIDLVEYNAECPRAIGRPPQVEEY